MHPIAKINLGLNVVARRSDGYHDLQTVFLPVPSVCDELTIEPANRYSLTVEPDTLCPEQDNLVTRAYHILGVPPVAAVLRKGIPSGAGMGGGSSDAAYMLRLLNDHFALGLSPDDLRRYAARLGADCPFFIDPQPAYATGIGDVLTPIPRPHALDGRTLLLVKPPVAVSTREAYAGITPATPQRCCRDIMACDIDTWRTELTNDFEATVFRRLPLLATIKDELYRAGARYAAMSGSGSTMFAIFDNTPTDLITHYLHAHYYTHCCPA